ncbi:putative integral membrane protein [Clostridium tetanomorphum]|uniref:Transmembrane protein n=1 Tax=Clostridium tetanomorphum TaxID=1553 RepID=A0A923EA26_CLOTT|nr:hypothetical protein [Clostridium tetanomorphum]KAJ49150.1 hypothetical protein CTM_24653 [Clostridium tetanomorphum DSM 665]KAJ53272.1 hypothetical protein CTM_03239 [Clostridium tetanomorphum DSM 665]MBC2399392.1 hypothetical protein [Clostridium tetanomorphum]MBP1865696.1 putative integral membrane protein [Clostridium tetanomorphum]NRS86816.1 putative integral membrane protein [Clostridium tetanomorphum]
MDMNKAIRKQKKSYKRFMLIMSFIFFILPIVLILTKIITMFYIVYLVVIECLIIIAIMAKINAESLKFNYDGYKIKVLSGIRREQVNITCNRVVFVHAEDVKSSIEKDFFIVLISDSKFRSKKMLPINEKFLKMYPYAAFYYKKIKILNPEKEYFFTIIKRGKLYKYELLDNIYKSCVYAIFTDEAIEKIKEYRNELHIQ